MTRSYDGIGPTYPCPCNDGRGNVCRCGTGNCGCNCEGGLGKQLSTLDDGISISGEGDSMSAEIVVHSGNISGKGEKPAMPPLYTLAYVEKDCPVCRRETPLERLH